MTSHRIHAPLPTWLRAYAADFILGLTVDGLNGVRNRSVSAGGMREADPEFIRVLQLLREVQAAGAIGVRVEEDKAKSSTAVLFFRRDDVPAEIVEKGKEIRRLLKMAADQQKFALVFSPMHGADNELTVNSRSMLQVMATFASYMDVPEADIKEHRAAPAVEMGDPQKQHNVRIRCNDDQPKDAFAAVHYRGHWFWVDDKDWISKRALTAIMFFFTLADTGDTGKLPMITIPAQ